MPLVLRGQTFAAVSYDVKAAFGTKRGSVSFPNKHKNSIIKDMLKFNKEQYLLAKFEDDAVVFSLSTNVPYIINHTGLRVLELCNGKRDKKSIVKTISKEYEKEENDIRPDINEIITKYMELKILK